MTERQTVPETLGDLAKELDRHYLAPRYPDAFPEGAPSDYYTKNTAEQAIGAAKEVMAFVKGQIQNT